MYTRKRKLKHDGVYGIFHGFPSIKRRVDIPGHCTGGSRPAIVRASRGLSWITSGTTEKHTLRFERINRYTIRNNYFAFVTESLKKIWKNIKKYYGIFYEIMEYFIPLKTSVESPELCNCKISWMTTGTNESPIWGHESGSGRQVKMWLVHRSLKRRLTLPSISRPCDLRAVYKKGFLGHHSQSPQIRVYIHTASRDLLII